jgi:hypothetical protein
MSPKTTKKPTEAGLPLPPIVQRLLTLLDKADGLLSNGDLMLDGWPAAREWHAEYLELLEPAKALIAEIEMLRKLKCDTATCPWVFTSLNVKHIDRHE